MTLIKQLLLENIIKLRHFNEYLISGSTKVPLTVTFVSAYELSMARTVRSAHCFPRFVCC